MVKLIQCHSTVSFPTKIRVDGGSYCRAFCDKHLFYVLFFWPTYFQVSSSSTFLDAGVGLVPVNFLVTHTLHSLAPSYWTPTERTNNLYLISLNIYMDSLVTPTNPSPLALSATPKAEISPLIPLSKTASTIFIFMLSKYQSHHNGPHRLLSSNINIMRINISVQFIYHKCGHASHQRIQHIAKLVIYTCLPVSIPKLSHPLRACIIVE